MGKRIAQLGFGFQMLYLTLFLVKSIGPYVSGVDLFSLAQMDDTDLYLQLLYLPVAVNAFMIAIGFTVLFFETRSTLNLAISCLYLWIAVGTVLLFSGYLSLVICYLLMAADILVSVCLSIRFFRHEKWMVAAILVSSALPLLLIQYFEFVGNILMGMSPFSIGIPGIGNFIPLLKSGVVADVFYLCALFLPQMMSAVLHFIAVSTDTQNNRS